ncbi:MAG: copper chaperone PCu(A)C [Rhodospirillales bacterium]
MRRVLFSALAAAIAMFAAAQAQEYKQGDLVIVRPFARASAGKTGAAYLSVENGGAADRLVAAASPAAEKAELHSMTMDDAIMRMRRVDGIDIRAGAKTALEPGGLHVMLIGLKAPLKEGDSFPLTLVFARAGKIEVEVIVQKPGAAAGHQH